MLYNCGTWALTEAQAEKLDAFQRKLLRRILGIKWFDKETNARAYMYERSGHWPAACMVRLVLASKLSVFGGVCLDTLCV